MSGPPPPGMDCSCSMAANRLTESWTERCNTVLKKASPVLPGLDVVGRKDIFRVMEHLQGPGVPAAR